MSREEYKVRRMTRPEVDLAISWADSEGWNPGIHDAETFYITDPEGFFVGIFDDKPVASISAVSYGNSFGFLGFYIVLPQFRGRGFGIEIWNVGMEHLKGRNIGLDGVLEQQKLYERNGFKPSYRSVRYQGIGMGLNSKADCIENASKIAIEDLLAYDDQYFPVPRHVFIKSWIRQTGGIALAALDKDELVGYGVIRQCHHGYKIGPLFADYEKAADALFCALNGHVSQRMPIFMDIPELNSAAIDLAKRHRMYPVFETVRMYNKEIPRIPMQRIFGIASFELG